MFKTYFNYIILVRYKLFRHFSKLFFGILKMKPLSPNLLVLYLWGVHLHKVSLCITAFSYDLELSQKTLTRSKALDRILCVPSSIIYITWLVWVLYHRTLQKLIKTQEMQTCCLFREDMGKHWIMVIKLCSLTKSF